jgi:excisionase family DNA binding protein
MTNKRLTMTIPEAAKQLGIGRNQGYQAAKAGQIPTIKIGKRFLVPVAALENRLANPDSAKASAKSAR